MKKRWIVLAGVTAGYLVLVNATNEEPAYTFNGIGKQLWVAVGLGNIGHPCVNVEWDEGGSVSVGLPTDQCYRMSAPQRTKGVWIDEFEGSRFLPGGADLTPDRLYQPEIWLDVEQNQVPGLFEPLPRADLHVWEIEFVGRQTRFSGQHGHMGGSQHYVIVDQLISSRPLPAQPWAAAVNEYWRRKSSRFD